MTDTAPRLNFAAAAPKAFRSLIGFDAAARDGLDPALAELIQIRSSQLNGCAYCLHIRSSQLNGCAYCLHMHVTDARKAGEDDLRLHMIGVWREAKHFFSSREQAALALTEAVTLIADADVPDEVYAEAAARFEEAELAHVLAVILTVNTWNRVAVTTAKIAGTDERR
ncbi:carboxymuconolactone decarboxylase family protein [Streptosporangium jomthongense]|uniref:Carboxymuconolactone decarboxylase family protein n=1 Tax=Streptosporangium jomthongense TaxID=1193683 RepID=A0ABV8EYI3_9ACTN